MSGFLKDKLYSYPFAFVFLLLASVSAAMLFSRAFFLSSIFILAIMAFDRRVFFIGILLVVVMLLLVRSQGNCKGPFSGVVKDVRLSKGISVLIKNDSCGFYLFCLPVYDNINIADRVGFKANLKPIDRLRPSFRRYLDSIGVDYVGFAYYIQKVGHTPLSVFVKIRNVIEREFHYFLSSRVEYFLDSSFLGDNRFKGRIKRDFIKTQTSHLLVVSGLHMGFVFGLFYLLFYRLLSFVFYVYSRFNLKVLSSLLSLPFVVLYFFIAGFHIPAMRSFLMTLIFIVSIVFSLRSASYNALFMIASLFLAFNYKILLNPSFVLSFFMTFVALFLYRLKMLSQIHKYPAFILFTLLMSLFGMPIVGYYFSSFTPLSILSNTVLIPLFGFVVVPVAFIASLASFLPYGFVKLSLFGFIDWIVNTFLRFETLFASYSKPMTVSISFYELVIIYAALFLSVAVIDRLLHRQDSPRQTLQQSSF